MRRPRGLPAGDRPGAHHHGPRTSVVVLGATGEPDPGEREPLGRTAGSLADVVVVTDEAGRDRAPRVAIADRCAPGGREERTA